MIVICIVSIGRRRGSRVWCWWRFRCRCWACRWRSRPCRRYPPPSERPACLCCVVLNGVEIQGGDPLAGGEGDGGGFASGQALVADRHRDFGRPVALGGLGVDAEVAAAAGALSGV